MTEKTIEILNFISHDLLIGFGIYAILNFGIRIVYRKNRLSYKFDNAALHVAFALGILTALFWILVTISSEHFRITYLIQPLIWITLSLLLILNKTKRNLFIRLLFSFSFVLTYERFVILITSLHRDYLPSSIPNDMLDESLGLILIVLGLMLKLIEFTIVSGLYYWIKNKTLYNTVYSK